VELLFEPLDVVSVLGKKKAQELDVSNAVTIQLGVHYLKRCVPPSLGVVNVEAPVT
jgi:hypothetical protein